MSISRSISRCICWSLCLAGLKSQMELRGLVIMPYLSASYRWSSALVSTSSGFFLSSGMIGICAIVLVQVEKNTSLGSSVCSSTCRRLCISFLPATLEPRERSEGLQRQPFIFICSASDGPVSPLLCQRDELKKQTGKAIIEIK